MSAPSNHRSRRRGLAAVELALILPAMIPIVLLCVDFGRYAYTYVAVANAARAGAGYASTHQFTTSTQPLWEYNTRQTILEEMEPAFDESKIDVQPLEIQTEANGLRRVTVEVSYPFELLIDWFGWGSSVTLRKTVVMRIIL